VSLTFRASTADDVDELFGVWRRSVEATHDFVSAEDLERIAELVQRQYLPNAALTVACDDAGRALAFMGMTDNAIDALFVDSEHRGKGVGLALVDLAKERWPGGLAVEVNEQNEQAVGFYECLGFGTVARLPLDRQGRPYPLRVMTWPDSSVKPVQ
jgi:putative acetyltransferase